MTHWLGEMTTFAVSRWRGVLSLDAFSVSNGSRDFDNRLGLGLEMLKCELSVAVGVACVADLGVACFDGLAAVEARFGVVISTVAAVWTHGSLFSSL